MIKRVLTAFLILFRTSVNGFFVHRPSDSTFISSLNLYDIPDSSWSSKQWNWGFANGTGHDCALICRQKFSDPLSRKDYVKRLLAGDRKVDFEEMKLVLALAWQKGRWDGTDGGPAGYSEVLTNMANRKYENVRRWRAKRVKGMLLNDMIERYGLIEARKAEQDEMLALEGVVDEDGVNIAVRKCAGMVLKSMGFIEFGLS